MAICLYDQHESEKREKCHQEYCESEGFLALESKARSKGYRNATINEIYASAEARHGAPDLFCWQGGLWVRI